MSISSITISTSPHFFVTETADAPGCHGKENIMHKRTRNASIGKVII
jgi:hypothetical protein